MLNVCNLCYTQLTAVCIAEAIKLMRMQAVQWPSHLSIPPHQTWVRLHTRTKCSEIKHKATHVGAAQAVFVCTHKSAERKAAFVSERWVCLFALSCDGLRRHASVIIPLVACLPSDQHQIWMHTAPLSVHDDVCALHHVGHADYYFYFL